MRCHTDQHRRDAQNDIERKPNEDICDFDRIPSWIIFDQTGFDAGSLGDTVGGASQEAVGTGIGYTTPNLDPELGGWTGWSVDNQWELERGWIKKGDTLEELVEDIHSWDPDYMDLETLQASIDRWNELCEQGEDTDFGRANLAPISTPPPTMP